MSTIDLDDELESVLSMLDGNEEHLGLILDMIRKDGISEKSYAQVFRLLFWKANKTKDRIVYDADEKIWRRGENPISDMELISVFSEVVYIVRKCVTFSWRTCQARALSQNWLDAKEFAKTELMMDAMESFSKLRSCLKMAGSIMPMNEPSTASIDWEELCGENEEDPPEVE